MENWKTKNIQRIIKELIKNRFLIFLKLLIIISI